MSDQVITDAGPAPLWFTAETPDVTVLLNAWGSRRLGAIMAAALNSYNRLGSVDAGTAASALDVADSTIRRWIREGVPASRIPDVVRLIRPPQGAFNQEYADLLFARNAVRTTKDAPDSAQEIWGYKGYLERWDLAVVKVHDLPVLTLRMARTERPRTSDRRLAAGGEIIELATFSNYFAATVARSELLEDVYPYRVQLRHTKMPSGAGKAFLDDAPRKTLVSYRKHPRKKIRKTTAPHEGSHSA